MSDVKKITKLLLWGFFAFSIHTSAYASITSISDAINTSGQQRMITQRMLKDYALIGMNNIYGSPKEDLPKMITLFDTNLNELKSFIKDKPSLKSLNKITSLWTPIKKVLQVAPSKDKAIKLQESLETLLTASNVATNLIVKSSGQTSSAIVNTAGKQRMLSQRMASLYMLKVWNVTDVKFEDKLNKTMDEFTQAHQTLLKSKLNTKEIDTLLEKTGMAFMFFEMSRETKSKKYVPSLINKSATKILNNMNTVTKLYSKK